MYTEIKIDPFYEDEYMPKVETTIFDIEDDFDDRRINLFQMESYILDTSKLRGFKSWRLADWLAGDVLSIHEALIAFEHGTEKMSFKPKLLIDMFGDDDFFKWGSILMVKEAKRLDNATKGLRLFEKAIQETIAVTKVEFAAFIAGNISDDDESHNQDKLVEYYKSIMWTDKLENEGKHDLFVTFEEIAEEKFRPNG
jgi:hypothetical protein